ncbi:hypothetical protein P0Y35_11685 [Kiritimatiellaeota bacterium B1221]|nr:hypothetical protein [Kiritimatiellaeota bacterium B1221]
MKKYILVLLMGFMFTGCVSYSSYKGEKKAIQTREAIARNDGVAMRGLKEDGVAEGVEYEVSYLDTIKQAPVKMVGSAVADAVLAWVSVEGVQYLTDSGSSNNNSSTKSGRDTTSVTVSGTGNVVQVRGDSTSVSASVSSTEF